MEVVFEFFKRAPKSPNMSIIPLITINTKTNNIEVAAKGTGYENMYLRIGEQSSARSESIKGEEFFDQRNECPLLLHTESYDNNEVTLWL
jgi:hypothetical protein